MPNADAGQVYFFDVYSHPVSILWPRAKRGDPAYPSVAGFAVLLVSRCSLNRVREIQNRRRLRARPAQSGQADATDLTTRVGLLDVGDWQPDVLGQGFSARTIRLGEDSDGECVATLVRAPRPGRWAARTGTAAHTDVLYVHGWSDYFFQTQHAALWRQRGARFFALDLRRYGRSLRPGNIPGFVDDLSVYDLEIEAALTLMGHGVAPTDQSVWPRRTGQPQARRRLILVGHSTGGLTLALWAARNAHRVDGLLLNSPWLELQTGEFSRHIVAPLNSTLARLRSGTPYPRIDPGVYARSLHRRFGGEWEYNLEWRPEYAFATYPTWLDAVIRGHDRVAAGLGLPMPVQVWLSDRSVFRATWQESLRRADCVIDVDRVARRSVDLGSTVTITRFAGAVHDVTLSQPDVREQLGPAIDCWLRGYVTPRR